MEIAKIDLTKTQLDFLLPDFSRRDIYKERTLSIIHTGEPNWKPKPIKFPSIPYINLTDDSRVGNNYISIKEFLEKDLVITVKMDGSNVTITHQHCAARNAKTVSFERSSCHTVHHMLQPANRNRVSAGLRSVTSPLNASFWGVKN